MAASCCDQTGWWTTTRSRRLRESPGFGVLRAGPKVSVDLYFNSAQGASCGTCATPARCLRAGLAGAGMDWARCFRAGLAGTDIDLGRARPESVCETHDYRQIFERTNMADKDSCEVVNVHPNVQSSVLGRQSSWQRRIVHAINKEMDILNREKELQHLLCYNRTSANGSGSIFMNSVLLRKRKFSVGSNGGSSFSRNMFVERPLTMLIVDHWIRNFMFLNY